MRVGTKSQYFSSWFLFVDIMIFFFFLDSHLNVAWIATKYQRWDGSKITCLWQVPTMKLASWMVPLLWVLKRLSQRTLPGIPAGLLMRLAWLNLLLTSQWKVSTNTLLVCFLYSSYIHFYYFWVFGTTLPSHACEIYIFFIIIFDTKDDVLAHFNHSQALDLYFIL